MHVRSEESSCVFLLVFFSSMRNTVWVFSLERSGAADFGCRRYFFWFTQSSLRRLLVSRGMTAVSDVKWSACSAGEAATKVGIKDAVLLFLGG